MRRSIEVWFYVGVLLGLYGVVLTLAGIYQWLHPPSTILASSMQPSGRGAFFCWLVVPIIAAWPRPEQKDKASFE